MNFTNYGTHRRPEIFSLRYMPLILWKKFSIGRYFYRIHYKTLKDIDYIPKFIIDLAQTNKKFYIFLDDTIEGYARLNFKLIHKFVVENNLKNKVIYGSGHFDVVKEYSTWLNDNKLNSLFYVYFSNNWLWRVVDWTDDKKPKASLDKNQWYCCLNNRPREHRLATVTYLDYLNLLNKGIVSANDQDYEYNAPWQYKEIVSSAFENINTKYVDIIKNQIEITESKLPLIVDVDDLSQKCLPNDLSKIVYDKTLINLVTETYYFKKYNITSEMFITEKTWKVFTAKQIPVIIGPRGILKIVRDLGFDVFDDLIDNSYDSEPDSTRLFSAIEQLKKIMNTYTVEELSDITKQRRKNNFDHLLKLKPNDLPVWKVLDVY